MYPNYRISVEIILLHEGKVLLTKRAPHCKIAPNVWNVPAGKIKYDEIPIQGMYREAKEEINLDVELLEELSVRKKVKVGMKTFTGLCSRILSNPKTTIFLRLN